MMFGELQRAESTPGKLMVQTYVQRYGERLLRLIEGKASGELSPSLDNEAAARIFVARSRAWSCNRCWRVMWDVCAAPRLCNFMIWHMAFVVQKLRRRPGIQFRGIIPLLGKGANSHQTQKTPYV